MPNIIAIVRPQRLSNRPITTRFCADPELYDLAHLLLGLRPSFRAALLRQLRLAGPSRPPGDRRLRA